MDILECLMVSIGVSFGAIVFLRGSEAKVSSTIAVGLLGALLGLAIHAAMGHEGIIHLADGQRLASCYGAALALFLWVVAQRLFLQTPGISRD